MYQLATGWEIWERCQEPQSLGKRPIFVGKIPMVLLKPPFFTIPILSTPVWGFYHYVGHVNIFLGDFTMVPIVYVSQFLILSDFLGQIPFFFVGIFKSLSIFSIPIFLLVEIVTVFFFLVSPWRPGPSKCQSDLFFFSCMMSVVFRR